MNKKLNIDKIKEAMESGGFNQARLAKEMSVSRTIVTSWFKGEKFPKPDKLLKLAVMLGLGFNEIVSVAQSASEPVIAFRKKANRRTKDVHIERAKDMGKLLELLVDFLPFENLEYPPTLKQPVIDYQYIQKVALKIREDIGINESKPIDFDMLIDKFIEFEVVIIPVLWGDKEQHENALHIYLPSSKTTWVYLNLDSNLHDFKFWIAHELGHVVAPDLKEDEAEDFADAFAQALLFPEKIARDAYKEIEVLNNVSAKIRKIIEYADRYIISPVTILKAINGYSSKYSLKEVALGNGFYAATTEFNKKYPNVSEVLNKSKPYTTVDYIKMSKECFKTPFFDVLKKFISENEKSPGFIQTILETSFLDAKEIYAELTK
ncbi:MAG: helix-turn-helix domain-containing protein [Deltaproteobacteria bacterium]|nr:helix-turn-helix domain-containing protein [Deltaproteobacteria bacterium]